MGIALLDHDLRYIMVNQVMAEINGLAVEEYRGKHIADVIPHIASQVETIARDVLRNGKAIIGPEVATETAAGPGQQRVWRTKYYPIPALPGGPGVGVVVEDISESRASEARLHENELRWRRLMDANVVGIVISDTERVIDVNQRFLDMVGYRRKELIGEFRRVKLTPVEFAELDKAAREQLRSVGTVRPFEKEFVRKDGSRVPVLITGARLQEAPLSWIGFVMDLTELKHAERQMRESELRWRRLAESSIAGILVTNEERVLEANKAYLDIIGYSEEELKAGKVLRANLTLNRK